MKSGRVGSCHIISRLTPIDLISLDAAPQSPGGFRGPEVPKDFLIYYTRRYPRNISPAVKDHGEIHHTAQGSILCSSCIVGFVMMARTYPHSGAIGVTSAGIHPS